LGKAAEVSRNLADPVIDYSDTANGIVRFIAATPGTGLLDSWTSYDTATVKWDANAKDAISGNENVVSLVGRKVHTDGRIESYSITDAGGDGLIGGPGDVSKKLLTTLTTTYTKEWWGRNPGTVEALVLEASPGPDGDFNTAGDNVIYTAKWSRLLGADTLAYAEYADGDGDGVIVDNGAAQPSIVDVIYYEKNPLLQPFVAYNRLFLKVKSNGNSANDVVIGVNGEQKLVTGRVNSFVVLDTTGDSTVLPGEMASATFKTTVTSAGDSVRQATVNVVFDPQTGLQADSTYLYYQLHMAEEKQAGFVRNTTFDFSTADPVKAGQDPTSGHLEMTVTYSNGKTASMKADFVTGSSFSGTYTDPDGNTKTVTWDAAGNASTTQP
jgi:hypothetical protein